MSKLISIIIPTYKEEEEKVYSIINMIDAQIGIDKNDIEVIIVGDGPESIDYADSPDFFNFNVQEIYKSADPFRNTEYELDYAYVDMDHEFVIRYIRTSVNGGPGVARQVGIDLAEGEFVMFIDADDTLHNVAVLNFYLNEIKAMNGDFDMLSTHWIEEQYNKETNQYVYIPHQHDLTWMFAKIINRKFLVCHNIKFHEDLRVHEDSHFLSRVNFNSNPERLRIAQVPTYVWKYSDSTITRINNAEYTYNSFAEFLRAHSLALKENVMLNRPDMITEAVIQLMCYSYFTLNAPHWDAHDEYRQSAIAMLRDAICEPFKSYIENCPMDVWTQIYKNEQQKHGNYIERDNMYAWLVRNKIYNPFPQEVENE